MFMYIYKYKRHSFESSIHKSNPYYIIFYYGIRATYDHHCNSFGRHYFNCDSFGRHSFGIANQPIHPVVRHIFLQRIHHWVNRAFLCLLNRWSIYRASSISSLSSLMMKNPSFGNRRCNRSFFVTAYLVLSMTQYCAPQGSSLIQYLLQPSIHTTPNGSNQTNTLEHGSLPPLPTQSIRSFMIYIPIEICVKPSLRVIPTNVCATRWR